MLNFNLMSDKELDEMYKNIVTDNAPMSESQEEKRAEVLTEIKAVLEERNIIR